LLNNMNPYALAHGLLRVGVAFALLYPPIHALYSPDSWIGYFPGFTQGIVPDVVLLHMFGVIEVVLAFWILSNKKIYIPAAITTILLVAIVLFNWGQMEVLFRDLSIAAMSASLAVGAWAKRDQA